MPGWRNQAFDALIDDARRITDHEQRLALYQQADKILVEEALLIPLAYVRSHILVKPWVRYTPLPMFFSLLKDITILPH